MKTITIPGFDHHAKYEVRHKEIKHGKLYAEIKFRLYEKEHHGFVTIKIEKGKVKDIKTEKADKKLRKYVDKNKFKIADVFNKALKDKTDLKSNSASLDFKKLAAVVK